MHVVIIGAGEVGTAIAADLAVEHDVVVIDIDEERAEQIKYEIDVMTLSGDGTSMSTLQQGGIDDADMLIACTDDDKSNLLACETAKTVASPFTIARTKNVEYLRTWQRTETAFGVDFMVCSDLQSAENIVRVVGLPASVDVDPFAGGLVQMAEFEIGEDSPVAGQTIVDADRFESLTFAGLFRADEMILPGGDTVIEAGDRAVVIGTPESVQSFAAHIAPAKTPGEADDIVIVGGSEIAYQTARLFEERDLKPRLIEEDHERARELAEALPDTLVMEHDAADTEFLTREHVDEADILVAALDSDERNLLVSMLAKRLGTDRVVAVVDSGEYVMLFEEVGIDVAISPREVTAEEITRFTHRGPAENVALLEDDQAEVLELQIGDGSEIVDRSIESVATEIDADVVIGAITRGQEFITPRGDTVLRHGDHIVVFVEPSFADQLMSMV
jgi:trk system potassium uptake protein TrkA